MPEQSCFRPATFARIHAAGNLSDLGLSREQNLLDQARIAFARSDAALREKRERLNRILGAWGERTAWRLPEKLPHLPAAETSLERLESLATANRYDLAAVRKELELAARTLGIIREWRFFMEGDIGATAERDTDGQWVAGPSLSLELPIFDQRQARIAREEPFCGRKSPRSPLAGCETAGVRRLRGVHRRGDRLLDGPRRSPAGRRRQASRPG